MKNEESLLASSETTIAVWMAVLASNTRDSFKRKTPFEKMEIFASPIQSVRLYQV